MASSDTTLLERLAPDARQHILGTPLDDDQVRLQQLLNLAAADQARVVRLHLGLMVPWEQAIGSFPPADLKARIVGKVGDIVMVDVDALRPNSVNCTVFSYSLTDAGIDALVEDIGRRKQRVPVEITLEAEIIEGERRWRAARKRGDKRIWAKIIAERMTESEVRAYIFDAHATGRDASLLERLRFYQLAVAVLKERHGLPPGRPKPSSNEEGFEGSHIRGLAAKRAGLGSAEKARRALKVLEIGDEEVKTAMLTGKMSINGAHARLGLVKDPEPEGDDIDPSTDGDSANATALHLLANADESPAEGADSDDDIEQLRSLRAQQSSHSRLAGPQPAAPASNGLGDQATARPPELTDRAGAGAPGPNHQGGDAESGKAPEHRPPSEVRKEDRSQAKPKSETQAPGKNVAGGADVPKTRSRRAPPKKEYRRPCDDNSERQAFERSLESIVTYVAALSERDQTKAQETRDEAVLRLDAAVGGPQVVDEPVENAATVEQEPEDEGALDDEDADFFAGDDDEHDQGDDDVDLSEVEQDDDQEYSAESDEEEEDTDQDDDDGESVDPEDAELERMVGRKRMRGR